MNGNDLKMHKMICISIKDGGRWWVGKNPHIFHIFLKPSLTDPGMLSWSVRHQEEPEHHPDKTETSSHVEHRLPAQVVRHVASESEDDQSSNTSSRPEYSLQQTYLFLLV